MPIPPEINDFHTRRWWGHYWKLGSIWHWTSASHRKDGPAVEYGGGTGGKEFWIDGEYLAQRSSEIVF